MYVIPLDLILYTCIFLIAQRGCRVDFGHAVKFRIIDSFWDTCMVGSELEGCVIKYRGIGSWFDFSGCQQGPCCSEIGIQIYDCFHGAYISHRQSYTTDPIIWRSQKTESKNNASGQKLFYYWHSVLEIPAFFMSVKR